MTKPILRTIQYMTGALFMTFANPLIADQPPQHDPEQLVELDKLLVTAGLEPLSIHDVASSVTVITREEIEQKQASYLSELLRDVPGFAVSQSGGPGTLTQVRVRGAEANQLLVLIDGVRANDPAQGDEFPYQYALSGNIERIEIIRGPQSATWGSDAMAGVINIIHRKDASGNFLSGKVEGGSFASRNASIDGGYNGEHIRFNGGLSYIDSNGSNISRQGFESDGTENTTVNAVLEYDASDALTLHFSAQGVDASSEFDDIDFVVSGLPTDADRVTESEQTYLTGKIRFRPWQNDLSGSLAVMYQDTDNQNYTDGRWSSATAAETLTLRLRASLTFGNGARQNHTLSTSLERQEIDFSQRGIAGFFGDPNQDQSFTENGLALEYVGRPFKSFTWTLSGRLDDYSDFDGTKTWQLAASQQLSPALRVRGSLGTGSKTPTFTERFGFFEDFFIGNPDLKPESSLGWELGIETNWSEHRHSLQLAYFEQNLEDEIDGFVFDPSSFLFTAKNRQSDSTRHGIEAIFDTRIGRALTLGATYTFTAASEQGANGQPVSEVRRPHHMAGLRANYHFADERGNLNLNVNYTGKQLDNFFSPLTFESERVSLPAFTVIDIAGAWKLSRSLELTARVSNLFDEDYEEVLGFRRPGRAIYAGLRGQFSRYH